jgi:CDP-6-deoxy-D-xylo-4-hexulose-3-dehydrase
MSAINDTKKVWYAPNGLDVYGEQEITAVVESLRKGWLAGFGEKTIEFEKQMAELFGKEYGCFVNSGSSANLLAIACLNLPDGCEIITPACSFSTTLAPIIQLCKNYVPVFCDVGLNTYVPTVDAVIAKVTDKTAAIMIPNLIGNKPNWNELKARLVEMGRNDVYLIEDSCDTITKTDVTDVSTCSFYSSHIITTMGSGGIVMMNKQKHLKCALMYRDWGRIGDNNENVADRFTYLIDDIPYDYKFIYGVKGYNFKSSEANAAFGLVQIGKLKQNIEIRRKNIERYCENLKDIQELILPDDTQKSCWLAIPLQYHDRLGLLTYLESQNIQTRVLFAGNITRHFAFREYKEDFTNADIIMRNGFLLGAHNCMTVEDVDYVCDKIKEYIIYNYDKVKK